MNQFRFGDTVRLYFGMSGNVLTTNPELNLYRRSSHSSSSTLIKWQIFKLVDPDNPNSTSVINYGDDVCFRSYLDNHLVRESDGSVRANRTWMRAWEKWSICHYSDHNKTGPVTFPGANSNYGRAFVIIKSFTGDVLRTGSNQSAVANSSYADSEINIFDNSTLIQIIKNPFNYNIPRNYLATRLNDGGWNENVTDFEISNPYKINFQGFDCATNGTTLEFVGYNAKGDIKNIRKANFYYLANTVSTITKTNPQGQFNSICCDFVGNNLHIIGSSDNGKLWYTVKNISSNWSPFVNLENVVNDGGAYVDVACSEINGELHLLAASTDGKLWHTIRNASGQWGTFGDVEEWQTGDAGDYTCITCANFNNKLHVIVCTTSGKMFHTVREPDGNWGGWGDIEEWQTGDGGSYLSVKAVQVSGDLHVCAINTSGDCIHTLRRGDGTWQQFFGDIQNVTQNRGDFRNISCHRAPRGNSNDLIELNVIYGI